MERRSNNGRSRISRFANLAHQLLRLTIRARALFNPTCVWKHLRRVDSRLPYLVTWGVDDGIELCSLQRGQCARQTRTDFLCRRCKCPGDTPRTLSSGSNLRICWSGCRFVGCIYHQLRYDVSVNAPGSWTYDRRPAVCQATHMWTLDKPFSSGKWTIAAMTNIDVEWFKRCAAAGLIQGRMLEVGAAKVQGIPNLCDIAKQLGVEDTTGVDITQYDGVDLLFDFSIPHQEFDRKWRVGRFSTVCIFNVLEHTFDALTVLENALSCVEQGGYMLVVTPSVWPIHKYPGDYNRFLPDWYVAFARRHNITLLDQHFCWLSDFGLELINSTQDPRLPNYLSSTHGVSWPRYWISRISHKLLNTYGRSHWATHTAIGAVFSRS